MERRQFIKVLGLSSLFLHGWLRDLFAAQGPVVAVAQGTDHAGITRKALSALGGMQRFVKPGQTVVVKPNIGWDRTPEYAATTNPVVVRTLVEECLKAGAKKVKVFDRTCNDPRRCYASSGIEAALKGMKNVEVKHLEEERFKNVALNGKVLKEWELYGEAVSADVYINVPVAKHHGLSRLTLGMKNVMGIMGGNRGSIHKNIDQALADVNAAFRPHLTLIDATRILTAHGPQGGNLADVKVLNQVIASTDIVAADAYATTLFGLKPADIAVTRAAYRRGLGEMNLDRMRIVRV
ncbi:DUF362 domain-containing protein [Geomonas subterranea]|uniref:DUF362 domain-containing protein n=1 Tax=Geomonas subterranea TaxID=2847989 RepID=A0ABX8LDV9_9BACT|nr:DUF362 domain-containing protein [Geomonas subterranea]QXE90228.1 DUF362 domain-containing protein [Geomonas subterranea]QXM07647.1 DUF362 domain-containing protein [Geomonas subterranea]